MALGAVAVAAETHRHLKLMGDDLPLQTEEFGPKKIGQTPVACFSLSRLTAWVLIGDIVGSKRQSRVTRAPAFLLKTKKWNSRDPECTREILQQEELWKAAL